MLDRLAVSAGRFFFRFRDALAPAALLAVVVFFPPHPAFGDPRADLWLDGLGLLVALAGQTVRASVIGLAYIKRGGVARRLAAPRLVREGVYAHCRNPMYMGNFLLLLGLALIDHSPWVYLVVLPSFALAFFCIVRAEEDFLRRRFGEAYEAYCSEVPRFLPRWKGLGTTFSASRFHWRRVVAKDYGTAFSWTTAALVLLAAERVRWFGAQAARAELAAIGAVWGLLAAAWATARWLKKRGSLREPSAGAAGQAEPPSLAPPGSGQRR